MLSYRQIRSDFQDHPVVEVMFVDYYAKLISPFVTQLALKLELIPNVITVLMMISGLIGAIFFALPQVSMKILGIFFIHLWYILDCSDGEVARISRRFSKFGKEIDYTAHVFNHPLFNLAFLISLLSLRRYPVVPLLFLCVVSISSELVMRNLLSFRQIFNIQTGGGNRPLDAQFTPRVLFALVLNTFTLYPTFALIFPLLYLIDLRFGTSCALIYLALQTAFTGLASAVSGIKWVRAILPL